MENLWKAMSQSVPSDTNAAQAKSSDALPEVNLDGFVGLQLNIRCEHYQRLQAAAAAQGITIGELIERMIDTWRAIARERD